MSKELASQQGITDMVQKARQRIIAKEPKAGIEQQTTEKANRLVNEAIGTFLRMRQIKYTPTTQAQAVEMIYFLLRDAMRHMEHDELLVLCAFQNAIVAAEKLRSQLI